VSDYDAPVRDMQFVLEELCDVAGIAALPAFAEFDASSLEDVLGEAGRFVAEVIAPTNVTGDRVGSRLHADATVETPPGFREAYAHYVDSGWAAAPFAPEHGGGGLPWVVATAIGEMIGAANMAFSLCPMLTHGAIHMLAAHGSATQRSRFLPPLVAGTWTGTMLLTEPQAGSDLGALTTRAVRQDDGTYRLFGQKIFITWGEHDLADNIVHIVLARTPDAPPGPRGISVFVVPKVLVDDVGSPGVRNDIRCVGLEHKMGIHGSPTCVMALGEEGGAIGELIGDEQAGLRQMFTMMNLARLAVGIEGLAIASRSFQQARAFAEERRQGRVAGIDGAAPIVEHPDVRRMLLTQRSLTEAMRALCYLNAAAIDRAHADADAHERAAAQELADVLTPVSKGWCTDMGSVVASLGVQVHGGMGYIEETGAAQHYRDVRIAAIYEGTNGIQALDLVGRKLGLRGGGAVRDLLDRVAAVEAELHDAGLTELWPPIADALAAVRASTAWLLERHGTDDAAAGATPYLAQLGLLLGGWLLARSAARARVGLWGDDFAAAKVATARFYLGQLLPGAAALGPAITAGVGDLSLAAIRAR
jgi:alkylation response protein AidB-like acyl-CoA dehydrogenase